MIQVAQPWFVRVQQGSKRSAQYLAVALGFAIPISTAATNALAVLIVLALLLAGDYRRHVNMVWHNPIGQAALFLFGLMVFSLLYTEVTTARAMQGLNEGVNLVVLLFLLPLFAGADKWRRYAISAFFVAIVLTLLLSFLLYFNIELYKLYDVRKPGDYVVFKSHIKQSVLMAFAAYLAVHYTLTQRGVWRWLALLLAVFCLHNIFFMMHGRTGYVVVASLILLLLFQLQRWRGLIAAALLVLLASSALYGMSAKFQGRVNEVITELQHFEMRDYKKDRRAPGETISVNLRLQWYLNSLTLWLDNPVFGSGVGSYETVHNALAQKNNSTPTKNPHNEYLLQLVQLGLLGLSALLYLFYAVWRYGSTQQYAFLAQGLVVTIMVGSLFNSLLRDFTEGFLFVYFAALVAGAWWQGQQPRSIRE